ncbi:type I restriction endonuclease subunit S [Corynebacterium sp. NML 120412]|uniref:restriction endonuclease subunit S n=1 Tax=Corynebacterium sp. NML 120412 TaxID=2029401 RepID=UPI000BAA45BC|nr:restriction endonuclease subunit S [Corynebacterium sp. NML 120412]PAT13864.1 type I restriction endonuclease subunit S [Corynebacterium sp. NML 120412]
MSTTKARTVPISLLGEVTLGKMVQPTRKNEIDELRPYLRAAHLPAPGTLSLDVSEQQMYFSPAELDRLDLQKGDVVIVEGGAGYGRSAYMDDDLDGWGFQNSIVRVRPYPDVSVGRYVYYALQQAQADRQIELEVSTATLPHFTAEKVGRFRLPLPPLETQRAIADYLDRETAEVDAMSADLDEMEALLTERRGSIIRAHLLPEDGEYTRVKLVANVSLGKTVQSARKRPDEVQRNYVRAAHIQPHGRLVLDEQAMWFTPQELEQLTLRENDVLVVEGGAGYGRSVVLHEDMPDWGFQNHVIRVRPNVGVVGEFVHYTFLAHYSAGLIDLHADGATIPALSSDKARELPILSVDTDEQRHIARTVSRETAEIDAMLADITELRDLLAERRAAVITAAVTGQIDVPTTQETTNG